jgi:hypothetical protein
MSHKAHKGRKKVEVSAWQLPHFPDKFVPSWATKCNTRLRPVRFSAIKKPLQSASGFFSNMIFFIFFVFS